MNANHVIECYVADVCVLLPRRVRNDVAFELRALLNEELRAKADSRAGGRGPDEAMAMELVRAFGSPSDVAARYRPTLTVIDPIYGRAFVRASIIGMAIIWCAGLVSSLRHPIGSGWDVVSALGRWWGGAVIPSLWWPGVLVAGYAAATWANHRRPGASDWEPRAGDRIQGGPAMKVLALFGVVLGLTALIEPRWVLDIFWGGHAAPAAYDALTYTDTFRSRQAPWLFVLLALNIPLFIAVIINGRWSPMLRRLETVHAVALCAVMGWIALAGPVFITPNADRTMKFFLVVFTALIVITLAIKIRRIVRPAPATKNPAHS